MVDIIKLKDLGFNIDYIPDSRIHGGDHIVHQMLQGYRKFGKDYIKTLAEHANHILGTEDQQQFEQELLTKAQNNQKDDALHCALSIMSINHTQKDHSSTGKGHSLYEANRVIVQFLKDSPKEKIQEINRRFPKVTKEIIHSVVPEDLLQQISA
jgi:hypothetical protein